MAATFVSLRSVFEKTLKTNEEDFGSVMKRAMTMSQRPNPADTLCELGRSEVVCLMAITSLGMLDVKMSITMSKAVLDFKLFPDITAYFAGKIRVEYDIPKSFLVRAYKFALYGNKLGFLCVPLTLLSFLRVLINEAKEEDDAPATNLPSSDNAAGPSSRKGHKTQKQQVASRSAGGPSSQRSGKPPNPPIGRPSSPPSGRTCSPKARPPTTSSAQPTPSLPSAKPTPLPPSAKPTSSAQPTPLPPSAQPTPLPPSAKPAPSAQPTPLPSSAKPTPLPSSAKPTPSLPSAKPTPLPPSAKPAPSAQPTPLPSSAKPTPSLPSAKPTPLPPSAKPTPLPPSAKPAPSAQPTPLPSSAMSTSSAKPAPTLPSAKPAPSLPSAKPAPSLPSANPTPLPPSAKPTPLPSSAMSTSSAKPAPSLPSAKAAPTPVPQKPPQFEGLDLDPSGTPYAASIPIEKALDPRGDVLLAYEMNGQPLSRDHGFPLRTVVPGIVGARNVKWLGRIVISEEESDSHWQQNDYKGFSPSTDWDNVNWESSPAIQELPVTSAICNLAADQQVTLNPDQTLTVQGYALAGGGRGIVRVDLTLDGGKSWHTASLNQEPQQPYRNWGWTLWSADLPVPPNSKNVEIWVKAVDSSYNTQPESFSNIWNLRGVLSNAYHRVKVSVVKE